MSRRKYDDWRYFPQSRPLPTREGIKAQTQRGQFGKNWWARRWTQALQSFGWSNRLQRGRSYARRGQVLNVDVHPGWVDARVQGSRRAPYHVRIEVSMLPERAWERAIDVMSEQAIFAAQLLAGEMPPDIETAFRSAGVDLFPSSQEISMECSCPDWAVPCKHIAAVYYLLAETFDEDPFLLFTLRGRPRVKVMEGLRARRAAEAEDEIPLDVDAFEMVEPETAPLTGEDLERFWEPQESLANFYVTLAQPSVETALLKRLGPPPFAQRPEAFSGALALAYATVASRALHLAFGDEDELLL